MANKKILLGLTYYLPNISGVTQYAVILSEELVKRNYEVGIICSQNDKSIPAQEVKNGVLISRVKGIPIGKGFFMPIYPLKSFYMVRKYEVINCHLPSVESFWLALWGKILKKKVVVTHHCEFNFTGTISNILISFLTYPIHLAVYLMADRIVSYTKDYAQTSIFLRYFQSKISYILPPIMVEKPKVKLDFGKGKIVGFVGRIGWEKGLSYLIESMKGINAKLILVGPYNDVVGDNTYEKLKNNKNIVFYGPLPHKELKSFYDACDCLVLPSTNNLETFGIVQAEAMRCGCPVVASNLPGVRVPVKMTGMGLISKIADSNDLQEKIKIVLSKGKKYYQEKASSLDLFDYRITVNEYEKVLG